MQDEGWTCLRIAHPCPKERCLTGVWSYSYSYTGLSLGNLVLHSTQGWMKNISKTHSLPHHLQWMQNRPYGFTRDIQKIPDIGPPSGTRDGHVSFSPNATDVPINPRHGPSQKNAPRCMIKEDKWLWRAVLSHPLIQRDGWVKPLSPRLHQYVPLCLTCSLPLSLFPRCSFRLLTHSELVEIKPHAFTPVLPLPGHSTKQVPFVLVHICKELF